MSITIEQSRRFVVGDIALIEIGGTALDDEVNYWQAERSRTGFGQGRFGTGRFGVGRSLGFGIGTFGRGAFGTGSRLLVHRTRARFVAGDYAIRGKSRDSIGNESDWSDTVTRPHRPQPATPASLAITSGTLTWSWSDANG